MHPCLISRFALALHHVSSITREQNHTSRKIFMLNMIYHLHKSDKINFCAFMPIEPRPIELKVSISKFIGKLAHTFGFCV